MLTPEEIKKIAKKFAEEMSNGDVVVPHIDFRHWAYAYEVLQWLSKDYCIVPKSKVKEKYALYKMGYTECEGLELGYVMDALEDIFGKSLFEEEEKL